MGTLDQNQALAALIAHLSASEKPVSLSWDEVQEWRQDALEALIALGLLAKDIQSRSLMCTGCEKHCYMPVYLTEEKQRAFVVCDDPERQSQMGRVAVPLPRLQQWQSSTQQFAGVIAGLLGLDAKPDFHKASASYRLGMLKGKGGRHWVAVTKQPLALVLKGQAVPLQEMLCFEDEALVLDQPRIDELLNRRPRDTSKTYRPDTTRREAGKLATQAMYQDWHDQYQALQREHPGKSDTWYSRQIAKLPVAQDKDPETIRKNMKK